jgi:hypothetical protein
VIAHFGELERGGPIDVDLLSMSVWRRLVILVALFLHFSYLRRSPAFPVSPLLFVSQSSPPPAQLPSASCFPKPASPVLFLFPFPKAHSLTLLLYLLRYPLHFPRVRTLTTRTPLTPPEEVDSSHFLRFVRAVDSELERMPPRWQLSRRLMSLREKASGWASDVWAVLEDLKEDERWRAE